MNTYLLETNNIEEARKEIEKITKKSKINLFDQEIVEFGKAIGIEDVRNIQKKIFLRPLRGDFKAIILILENGATIEAQNSMLKLLEEPPESSFIFLITDNAKIFLPTVLSRVKLIIIGNQIQKKNESGLDSLLSLESVGERLQLAQSIGKSKEEAIVWLEQVILSTRELMLKSLDNPAHSLSLRRKIHDLEMAHYELKKTNANTRLLLENTFLSI